MVVPVGTDSECPFNFPETYERDFPSRNCSLVNLCDIPLQKQLLSTEERLLQSAELSLHASSFALIDSRCTPPCSRAQGGLVAEV